MVSGAIDGYVVAMAAVGAPHRITDEAPPVAAGAPVGPFLLDLGGGVVRAAATGRFLLDRVGSALVHGAAGAGTPALAAQVGIELPAELIHHARFSFPLRDPEAVPPCWIDFSDAWRPGFTTYGIWPDQGGGRSAGTSATRRCTGIAAAVAEQSRQVLSQYGCRYKRCHQPQTSARRSGRFHGLAAGDE